MDNEVTFNHKTMPHWSNLISLFLSFSLSLSFKSCSTILKQRCHGLKGRLVLECLRLERCCGLKQNILAPAEKDWVSVRHFKTLIKETSEKRGMASETWKQQMASINGGDNLWRVMEKDRRRSNFQNPQERIPLKIHVYAPLCSALAAMSSRWPAKSQHAWAN